MTTALLSIGAMRTAVFASLVAAPSIAAACAYHGAIANNLALHPAAVDVIMALQAAEDAGTLPPDSATRVQVSMVAYHQTVKGIERFRGMLERVREARRSTPAFSLLLIDSALWSRLAPNSGGLTLAVHTDGPERGEPVVLTVGVVLQAVLDGRLAAADAINRGLIRVEAPVETKLELFDLISAVAPKS
jgi:hypothetical protein